MAKQIPFSYAKRQQILLKGEDLLVTAETSFAAIGEVQRFANKPLNIVMHEAQQLNDDLEAMYKILSGSSETVAAEAEEEYDTTSLAELLPTIEELLESEQSAPIVRLINTLIAEAINEKASDIHIDSDTKVTNIRIRKDGVLTTLTQTQQQLAPALTSRIKVMAKLDIAERRLPQDGRMTINLAGRPIDIRVSIIPSGHGERIVMRILDREQQKLDPTQLGLPTNLLESLHKLIKRPHGIILVTGPTGSGKTTTLYAMLQSLNCHLLNVMTIEDPIEYDLDSISQTAVNEQTGLTFAKGLRSILRQDPDVILVGEIRDLETAKIAIQASQTGHLVFATLHTNNAMSAITRLQDMGIPGYLIAASLVAVLSQRLVRCLCTYCKPTTDTQNDHGDIQGCSYCLHTGYRGRTGLFELLELNKATQQAVHDGCSEQDLLNIAGDHFHPMVDDGIDKVNAGITSDSEVKRVYMER